MDQEADNNNSNKDLDEFSDTGFSLTSEEARHWERQLLDNNSDEQQTLAAQAAMDRQQGNQQVLLG